MVQTFQLLLRRGKEVKSLLEEFYLKFNGSITKLAKEDFNTYLLRSTQHFASRYLHCGVVQLCPFKSLYALYAFPER